MVNGNARIAKFPAVSDTVTLREPLTETLTLTAVEVEGINVESPL
jgi:hypothetical protein